MAELLTVAEVEARTGVTLAPEDLDRHEARALTLARTALGRRLVSTERTEALRAAYDGWAYVDGPVTAAQDRDGEARDFEPHRIWFGIRGVWAEVTYTAGWTTQTAPDALLTGLALGVAQLADSEAKAAQGDQLSLPAGASEVQIGDLRIRRGEVPRTRGVDGGELPPGFEVAAALGSQACWLLAPLRRVRT